VDAIIDFIKMLFGWLKDPRPLVEMAGIPGMALIIFLETGAMVFLLPGDSMLFVAGLFAAEGTLNIFTLNAVLIPCAILGDATSYFIGARSGGKLFSKPESRFFKPAHLQKAAAFYEKHGGKAIIIARFMPIVRTFVPVVAGMAKMSYRRFATYNIIGAAAWVLSMTLLGYFAGKAFPAVGKHIEKVIILIVLVSITPGIWEWWKSWRAAKVAQKSAAAPSKAA
jgi:membrane-associated protein